MIGKLRKVAMEKYKMLSNKLHDEAMKQYGDLEYPVTDEELFCTAFEAGVKFACNILREEELKDVDRTMNRALDALMSWKSEAKE